MRIGLVLGFGSLLGCLLGACRTVDRTDEELAGLRYLPAPRSTLVERQHLPFRLAQAQRGEAALTVLAWQEPDGEARPVSLMTVSGAGEGMRVAIRRLPLPGSGKERDELDVAALEYLYTLVLRQEPEARFSLDDGRTSSHAGMLRRLAGERQLAAARTGAGIPWQVVSLAPAGLPHADPDEVSVRIAGEHGLMEGVTVYFNRAPHSSCEAKSGTGGLASCRLVDQHGDDDEHAGKDSTPVLALYPGDIRKDRVLLPTTLMLKPAP